MNESLIEEKVDKFFSKFPLRTFDKGVILLFADENPKNVMYLKSGRVIVYEISPAGENVIINTYKAKAFFPMAWAINKTPNRYYYEAELTSEIISAPAEKVIDFLTANPEVLLDLLSRVYRGAEGLLRRTAHLMGGKANSRLVFEIIVSTKRFGKKQNGSWSIKITENELAERTGLSRETVSREIGKLKKLGLIKGGRGQLEIEDIGKLESHIGDEL